MRVFCLCTDAVDASILLMHWSCWYNYVVDALMLMMCWYCWCEYALMQWRCWCSDATDVLMLMMQVCCWCTDSADTLMLLVLMHQWCWSTDAAEALMLLVMMCWSSGVTKKHQKFIFEYWVFSRKSYLNMWCFEKAIFAYLKFNICIPKLGNLHTMSIFRHTLIFWVSASLDTQQGKCR